MRNIYCVFCKTGTEAKTEAYLSGLGFEVITSLCEINVVKNHKTVKMFRPLMQGYVFFSSETEPDWKAIIQNESIYHPVVYADNHKELKGRDLEFIRWLLRQGGKIKVSQAIEEGTRIKIISGPLKEYEGSIVKVNRRQKIVAININTKSVPTIVWLSYDLVEKQN